MVAMAQKLIRYIQQALGVDVTVAPCGDGKRLPPLLRHLYRFAELRLLDAPLLLMIDPDSSERPPASVRKHMDLIEGKRNVTVVNVRRRATA